MNFFELLEAVKNAPEGEKAEITERYYKKERIIVKSMLESKYSSQEGRRTNDIER